MSRAECKIKVKERSKVERFSKPRNGKSGIYALIMDSDKFFYDRFCVELDTYCFECGRPIKGKAKDFPKFTPSWYDERFDTNKESEIEQEYGTDTMYYFCSYDCKHKCTDKLRGFEGEFQSREGYDTNGGVYGYIYHIYNRIENKHYVGQTRYMPFFRWQEHAKQNIKGNICDLVFETVCEVRVKSQDYLNNIEAWWIQKYIDDYGKDNVMNLTNPKITVANLVEHYNKIHTNY